jgi:hypothetical protein
VEALAVLGHTLLKALRGREHLHQGRAKSTAGGNCKWAPVVVERLRH